MRITLINQTFYPDVVSSGQHLSDLALRLAQRGHQVTVITSRRGYDDVTKKFPKRETWRGVNILRVFNTGFGKNAKWKRAANFATFLLSCCYRLCLLPRQDTVVALTSPPLVSFIAAWFARLRGASFCYWVMDLNPDEAVAAGWLNSGSLPARILERFSRFSLRQASSIVVLDRFMKERILAKGIQADKIVVLPPWSHDSEVNFDVAGRDRFRKAHGFENKFVVMYSGNHSPCHPLDTLLEAAQQLAGCQDIAFCFVGGGAEFARVKNFALKRNLSNIICLPYQPLDQLAGALSAADLHLVVMGNPFVGMVHPCKAYNILRVGSPLLYIGPEPSHISELLAQIDSRPAWRRAAHGEVDQVVRHIMDLKLLATQTPRDFMVPQTNQFSEEALLPVFVDLLESVANGKGIPINIERKHSASAIENRLPSLNETKSP